MSVFVNDMDMPERCRECDFLSMTRFGPVCQRLKKRTSSKIPTVRPDCPLTAIPSVHGRLIDADKLVWFIDNHIASGKKWVEFETIKDMINSLPTIIEAEVSDK